MNIKRPFRILLCYLFLLGFSARQLYAQHCYTVYNPDSTGTPAYRGASAVCNGVSPVYNDYFKKVENYRPYPFENLATTTTKVIKIRAIVVNNSFYGPTANYPVHYADNAGDREKIRKMLETWCNSNTSFSWQHMGAPSNARTEVCSTKCYVEDAKFRIKLVGIKYVSTNEDMTLAVSPSNLGMKATNHKYHLDAYGTGDKDSILNVFLVNYGSNGSPSTPETKGGAAFMPNLFDIRGLLHGPCIIMYGSYNSEAPLYPTFMHELGHTLGLHHTYYFGSECSTSAADFLYDVFGYNTSFCYYPDDTVASCNPYLPENKNKCSNNLMGRKWQQQVYLSPTQLGRMHRTAHLGNVSRYLYPLNPPGQDPWQITSDQQWDFGIRIYQDIIVKAGKTLTITCEVQMPPGGRITVEKGAKLVLDGGTITSYHEKTGWHGIQLYGDITKPPYAYNQGSFEMKNDATIEYAYDGVQDFTDGVDFGGGIIQVSNSTFKDCRRAIELNDYPGYPRGSSCTISNMKFLTTNPRAQTNTNLQNFPMVSSYNERDVLISNCIFKNTIPLSTPLFDAGRRNRAIYSEDAGFRIEACSFKGYKEAINIGNHSNHPFRSVKVMNCSFDSVATGILFADNFSYAQGNTFDHPLNYTYGGGMIAYLYEGQAIYADNAGGLTLTTNTVLNSGGNTNSRGITINRSLATGARVIDNSISNARLGIITQNDNPALDLLCNHFGGGAYNLLLNPQSPGSQLKDQGTGCNIGEYRAGNTFSSSTIKHIASYLSNPNWAYYYWQPDPNQIPNNISGSFINSDCTGGDPEDPNSQCDLPANVESLIERMDDDAFHDWAGQISPGALTTQQLAAFAGIVHHFNTSNNFEGLLAFLVAVDHIEAKKLLVPLYLEQGNYDAMERVINNLKISAAEQADLQAYYTLLRSLKEEGRSIYKLDETELAQVRQIAAGTFDISARARSLLAFAYGEEWLHYQEQLPPVLSNGNVALNGAATASTLYDAAPNPAQSTVRIELELSQADAVNSRLAIRNMMGKVVQDYSLVAGRQSIQLELSHMPAGVYTYSLQANGKVLQVKRLVVLK